ncbi:hypothetical protein K1T71_011561 [Dendrolimus kikuchii]|uniref:Uncharacterized protein n=1 Tax=Dendrolimus kikuchii TaxID=765133 RepID=A0ACC1CP79_9NEOP|nr:hypothetical protein K1T71_011561 [Dendrolimus kikuchii]
MSTAVMKVEMEAEACCICGGTGGDLMTPEEHDAGAPHAQTRLRAMLLHINNAKVVPDGRFCENCIRRTIDAYEFSTMISSRNVPPLSEKIRALRRRLHELTQKIDVFIVVGGAGGAGGAYSEDDIVAVDRAALAAAAAADDEDLERARNARGEAVYQCSVCPQSFQRVSEFRAHCASHPAGAVHSCWTCGAQFAARAALAAHGAAHALAHALVCHLCDATFQSQSELRRHEGACPSRCPLCAPARVFPDRGALSAHVAAEHGAGVGAEGGACAACFRRFDSAALLSAHMLRHRQAKQFVCGYDGCILRFATRNNLMAHIRKCHSSEAPEEEELTAETPTTTCHCGRTFGSVGALKRHARVHRSERQDAPPNDAVVGGKEYHVMETEEGAVEYLEVETLEAEVEAPVEEGEELNYEQKFILSM